MAHATIRTALQTHRLPTRRLRQRLTEWLTTAQEAAAVPVLPFRSGRSAAAAAGNGAGHGADHSNGADHAP
jgi:hypothetical protein